jgi:hypothetical protein
MIAAQLADTVSNALARLRAAAFGSGRPVDDVARVPVCLAYSATAASSVRGPRSHFTLGITSE